MGCIVPHFCHLIGVQISHPREGGTVSRARYRRQSGTCYSVPCSGPQSRGASPEYVQITGRGDSKYPAIADGDTVTVEMITEVNTIKVGDIIVYGSIASLAWNPNPTSIWIAHRVTEKYVKDGGLCFRTKGDNKRSRGNISIFIAQIPFFW